METTIANRHQCRRIDIVKMFFGLAHSIKKVGNDFFMQPLANGGAIYTFRLGQNLITYSVQKGGAAC